MAIAYVRSAGNNGNGNTASLTWSAPSAGNLLVAFLAGSNPASDITPSGAWAFAGQFEADSGSAFQTVAVYTKTAVTGDTTPSFALANTGQDWCLIVYEASGANNSAPVNQFGLLADDGALSPSAEVIPQVVPSVVGCLPITAMSTGSVESNAGSAAN